MALLRVFAEGGIVMYPLVVILCVVLGVACRAAWLLRGRGEGRLAGVQSSLDRLLFWGGLAVVIGILGSAVGYHKAMAAVVARGAVNPPAVWIGTAEGMVSTLAGLILLIVAGVLWFGLRTRYLRVRRPEIGRA
jgi:hypothetical protein